MDMITTNKVLLDESIDQTWAELLTKSSEFNLFY